jgi:hypothetical protein
MQRLVAGGGDGETSTSAKPGAFGDLVRAVRATDGDPEACRREIERARAEHPELAADLMRFGSELLCDRALRASRWDPDEDDACDGIAFAPPLSLVGRKERVWKQRERDDHLFQAATLVFADLEAIKAAENDYRTYNSRPGANYERIGPIQSSYVKGVGPDGEPFSALRIEFESDLPFPFSTFTCDLHVLNRIDARKRLVCDIYSNSKDFHWLAGRDHYFPVRASDGEWVAMLIVRWYGFDLRGVPDDDDARRAALRASLGGLRLEAERLFRLQGGVPRTVEKQWPTFELLGKVQR